MDFGLLGMEGLVGHHQQQQNSGSSDQDGKRKCNGSGSRSGSIEKDDTFRVSKMARNDLDLGISKAMAFQQQQEILNPVMRSTGSQMLSFSSPSPVYSRNAGYASGSMHGSSFTGIRGPFTPAQWIELEHQALIYKYFTANVPVPATLLVPISRAFNLSGFSGFPAGSFPAHSYGWGPFHLGYSNSTDPEPGRCRRTDGKKWRCSRDAVPDQKYCERHINRGRHRSRKPVEGQTGQAASAPTNAKVAPMSSAVSSNNLALPPHQLKGLQAAVSNLETNPVVNRLQDSQGSSVMPTIHNLKSKDSPFSIPKQQYPFEESVQSEFGFVSNESLLNPSSKTSYMNCKNYNSFSEFNDQQTQDPNPVHHFIDDWQPKDHSNRSNLTWPEELKSDWTQLSMSIPMSGLSSSSTNQEKIALSSLRLSRELDQNVPSEVVTDHGNWIPVSWGSSMGGPLGEVVNKSGDAIGSGKNTSPLNLMSEGRDENKNSDDLLAVSAHAALSSIPAL